MTVKKAQALQDGSAKENVLQRVLQLPVVSSTCETLQRKYSSTKESHPLMASVCEVYERGVQGAGALAMWGMEPVVRRLEPQFAVANDLACRGLDHLEEKIPALQYPVDKLASELKDTISCPLQSAKSTIGSSMDKIIELAAEGYEATKSTVETTAKYTRKNSVTQMAAAGVDTALGGLEKLMEYLLPEEDEEAANHPKPPACQNKGQELVSWIPILGSLAKPSAPAAPQARSDGQGSAGWPTRRHSKAPEQKQEKAGKKDTNHTKAGQDPGLVGSVAHNLQTACASGISSMKKVPAVAWDAAEGLILFTPRRLSRAMETVDALGGTLVSAPKHLLGTLYSYVPDPLFLRHNYYRSPAFDPDYPFPRKSAFSPYNRRVSEGSYRFSPESMYSRAYYGNYYSPVFKKD
ncbi:hypothetical protein DUI87_29129 [Hirundo rustica rustica]|uniref:Perilipin n=1 Tax=Hirundo rustica rustica TaxID=333673 RepID=A0A3M0IYE2_HIRRU|nr:hypothetical protein DUI87_29129 [Hirundo rustica rustica]